MATTQTAAVSARRRLRSSYGIDAEAKRLPEMYALREQRQYREDMAAQRAREFGLAEEGQKLQEKQAKIATGISAAQVGATGYMARSMTAGGSASGAQAGAVSTGGAGGAGGGGAASTSPAGAGVAGYAGAAGAGYAGGKVGGYYGERNIPESAVKGGRSRRRWGGMAGGAAAGAAYGTMVAPGVGTGVGAIIGGVAGLIAAW